MALIKLKPTSAGRRHAVKVVNPELHKGKPFAALVERRTADPVVTISAVSLFVIKAAATRRPTVSSTSSAIKTVFPLLLNVSNTIRTAPPTSLSSSIRTANAATSSLLKA